MDFRTKVELPLGTAEIRHDEQILVFGSCFSEHIGNKLLSSKFLCDLNPFGVLYNPLSIAKALRELSDGKLYKEEDLVSRNGLWHSWMHHGSFSMPSVRDCLEKINSRMACSAANLAQASWLLITWGTAWVYEKNEDGQIVGNCHKFPEKIFSRRLLEVNEIVSVYTDLITDLCTRFSDKTLKILFTISPVRHVKDTMHGNQISKSVLQLAVHQLCSRIPDCYYFPSYEIMMDELRDYRFYAEDMIHPSGVAVDYIWQCFSESYFSSDTMKLIEAIGKIRKALEHRPFYPDSPSYYQFISQNLLKIQELKEKFPYLDVQNEITLCQAILKK